MKKLILTLALVVMVSFPVIGQAGGCESLSKIGAIVMGARQSDARMSDLMDMLIKEDTPELNKLIRGMIIDAYAIPNYSTEKMKMKAIREFENEIYRSCIDITTGD